jgi:NADH dehydrogenase
MATVAKEKQLLILPKFSFQGRLAWFTWMFVHLMLILSVKNKLYFCKLMFSYFNNDSTLRVLLKPHKKIIENNKGL